MEKNNTQFQTIIKYLLSLLAFLMPVFFLPITLEKFEFNKLSLLIVITGISLILWTVHVITNKEIKVAKTPFDLPGILFLVAVLLSGIFSIDKTSSIFGLQGRWFPSILSFFALGVFYITLTSNIKQKKDVKMVLLSFVTGSTLATLIGIFSYYGISLIPQTGAIFNPTGSLVSLGILSVITCAVAINEILKGESLAIKLFSGVMFFFNFFYLALYNKPLTWVLAGIAIAGVLLTTEVKTLTNKKLELLSIGVILTACLGLILTPITKPMVVRNVFPNPVRLNFGESWDIVVSSMRDFPLVGTGPSTFYLNYPRYRSAAMNRTDYWNVRFDKPFSEALVVIGTFGILGILLGAYLDIEIIKNSLANLKKQSLNQVLAIGALLMVGIMYVTTATVLTGFTFVLFMALLGSLVNSEKGKYLQFSAEGRADKNKEALTLAEVSDENSAFLTIIMVLPLLAFAGLGFFSLYKIYPSEYYMQKAVQTINTDAASALEYQIKAIQHNPQRSNYYNTYAQTNLALALNLSQRENLNDTQRGALQNLISTAIRTTKVNTEQVNSLNPRNWEVRGQVYNSIRGAAENADQWARQALETAIDLDPNNPRLWVELGGFYFAQENYLQAANYFRQATNLKPDYANAYYNFAQAAKQLENYGSAKRALELVQNIVPQDSEDYSAVEKEIEELDQLLAQLQEQQGDKPTVEELAQQAEVEEAETITEQEPLTVEGENDEVIEQIPENVEGAEDERQTEENDQAEENQETEENNENEEE